MRQYCNVYITCKYFADTWPFSVYGHHLHIYFNNVAHKLVDRIEKKNCDLFEWAKGRKKIRKKDTFRLLQLAHSPRQTWSCRNWQSHCSEAVSPYKTCLCPCEVPSDGQGLRPSEPCVLPCMWPSCLQWAAPSGIHRCWVLWGDITAAVQCWSIRLDKPQYPLSTQQAPHHVWQQGTHSLHTSW